VLGAHPGPRGIRAQRAILLRQVQIARGVGARDQLRIDLGSLGTDAAWTGDFAAAAALIAETDAVCEATGSRSAPFAAMLLASLRATKPRPFRWLRPPSPRPPPGQGIAVTYAHWAAAILANGLGRYADAREAAEQASQDKPALYIWHLRKVFTKLGVSSRRELSGALANLGPGGLSA
jgi:hypothetical protein